MLLVTLGVLAQLAGAPQTVRPVLAFPEPGLDDSAAYQGYATRFYRDGAGNTVQIYLDRREGRVVHLWANAENESIGLSARDARGRPLMLQWDGGDAHVSRTSRWRTLEYRLTSDARTVQLGWFLLGSMRVERDFQAWGRHRAPFGATRFVLPELERLLASLERLDITERVQHLALLGAPDLRTLRARLHPRVTTQRTDSLWLVRVVQPTLDARDTLLVEVGVDPRQVSGLLNGQSIILRARSGARVSLRIRIATTGVPLTPVTREEIFTPEFLQFAAGVRAGAGSDSAAIRARWLERQMLGVELLASREKLMAGLPTYATYFGRDMLMSALMMRPIWRDEVSEFVVASVLRKLSPAGQVSHEEALGGQAVRESAAEYARFVDQYLLVRGRNRFTADSLLAQARIVLQNHRRVRENYNMIDDDLQLPILAARWITDPDVAQSRKRAFLVDTSDGADAGTRLDRLIKELALVARMTEAYAREPVAANLVSFAPRDSGWAATSWRDSNVGYAGGRFAMDVNAIWAPHALHALGQILNTIRSLGFPLDSLAGREPALASAEPLGRYARDSLSLQRAVTAWSGAWRHFLVQLGPAEIRSRVTERLAVLPAVERDHWMSVLTRTSADRDSLAFLALSLDAAGTPIRVANSDPATRLFLGEPGVTQVPDSLGVVSLLRDVRLFVRPYPVGLFIEGVGPVVANDAFATPPVWAAFERDLYHGPRVAWGREVNLFVLGVANRIEAARGTARTDYVGELRAAAERVQAAVEASGFQSELWSYRFDSGRPVPVRYGSGADVQLWSTTDLAVQFALWRLRQQR